MIEVLSVIGAVFVGIACLMLIAVGGMWLFDLISVREHEVRLAKYDLDTVNRRIQQLEEKVFPEEEEEV